MPHAQDRLSQPNAKPAPVRRGFAAWVLPMCGWALLAILPVRVALLIEDWMRVFPPAPPLILTAETNRLDDQPDMLLADGVTARTVISSTLAGGMRSAPPVGDERPADGRLLAEVARRQAELDRRQRTLETKAAQVEAAETLARAQITELTRLRTQIEKLVVHETGAADADIDLLVGLYSNMKPVQAAAVLGKMEPPRAGLILQKLGDRAGGPILAAMDPNAALAISEEIAQRRSVFRR